MAAPYRRVEEMQNHVAALRRAGDLVDANRQRRVD